MGSQRALTALTKRSTSLSRLRTLRVSHSLFFALFSLVLQRLRRFNGLRDIFCGIAANWSLFGWEFTILEARVSDLGRFLFLSCITASSNVDPSPFMFVKVSGMSLYQFLLFTLLCLHLVWFLNDSSKLLKLRASSQLSCLN